MIDELQCLKIEIETNFVRDPIGRLLRERVPDHVLPPFMVIASAFQGRQFEIGAHVPEKVAGALREIFSQESATVADPAAPPMHADRYQDILGEAVGPVVGGGVPCFVIGSVSPPILSRRSARIVRSVDGEASRILDESRPEGHVDESRGPWAAVVEDGRIVSICSTARAHPLGAEAGTWTDPSYRGNGYASAATLAWAELIETTGRVLFYCTDEWNNSSRGVAARLGLHPIGWMWKVIPAPWSEMRGRLRPDDHSRSRAR